MVMVTANPVGELVADKAPGGVVQRENPGGFEHREGTVKRGEGATNRVMQFSRGLGPVSPSQSFDH